MFCRTSDSWWWFWTFNNRFRLGNVEGLIIGAVRVAYCCQKERVALGSFNGSQQKILRGHQPHESRRSDETKRPTKTVELKLNS